MRTSVAIFLFALALSALAQTATREWHVRLPNGSDAELTVTQNAGNLEFRRQKSLAFTVPVAGISSIFLMTQRYSRSHRANDYFSDRCCPDLPAPKNASGMAPNTYLLPNLLPMLAEAVAAPLGSSKDYYVEIRWFRNGQGITLLKLAKNDYAPFLDWLQQVSGTQWVNIDEERQRALREIEQRKNEAFYLVTGANRFRVLPMHMHGETELYFFSDEVKPKNLVHILPVTEGWSDNKCVTDAELLFRKCNDEPCPIDAVLLPIVTYRVIPPEGMDAPTTEPSLSDCEKLSEQKRPQPAMGDGRPTIRKRD
jgi:hypothetical protein